VNKRLPRCISIPLLYGILLRTVLLYGGHKTHIIALIWKQMLARIGSLQLNKEISMYTYFD